MPAFDPVRDAVLNSPVVPSNEHPPRMHIDLPTGPPTRASSSLSGGGFRPDSSPSVSTPLTRRATDLSVLLNSDPPPQDTPLFTPTTPRGPATLSHLLHHADADRGTPEEREALSNFAPLRRRSSGVESGHSGAGTRDNSYFSFPGGSSRPAVTASMTGSPLMGLALPGSLPTPQPPTQVPAQVHPSSTREDTSSPASAPPPYAPPVNRSPVTPTLSNIISPNPVPVHTTSRPSSSHSASSSTMPSRPSTSTSLPQRNASASMPPPLQPATRLATPPLPKTESPQSPKVSARAPRPTAASLPGLPPKPPVPTGLASLPPKPEVDPPPPFPIKRSSVPYAPKFRRTPASSVLVPLSPAEMERYRNFPGGVGTMLLRKRKREDGDLKRDRSVKPEEDDDEERRKRRRTGDVAVVVEHYNARPDVGVSQRQESPIIGLKSFNNWVKSVLITRFAHPALAESPVSPAEAEGMGRGRPGERPGGVKGRVLDMGCGKGGDLTKWAKARIKEYVGVDIAAISVDQARLRHASLRGPRFTASFFALDCYEHLLRDRLPPAALARPFDAVSMQFCMHYAFESEKKARCMLRNVSENLRPGGTFIGTIPDAGQLLERLDALPKDAKDLSFGNSVYTIRFEDRTQRPLFGHRYWFFLKDAVDDVPEYVVHWDKFVQLAAEYGLHPIYKEEFHQVFKEHSDHPEFAPLLERMHVVDKNGESQMDEDQWEAANIYIAFALEKR
ncbi:hypothetical protein DAEQUDRAFT_702380 [Daedalea quercina L-15889]|uniref:mRNA cap guanine-N(7) methyltransferase n=1 Tax=Daedalea quercina L-15889 TaxID=1314783 RepID=A0A165TYB5_9APHY|nr:hypothetical protein DAEQUDRAFT_702380 [Daedalea quercina L-15889]